MRVAFDLKVAQPMGTSKYHGGGEYVKTIFRELVVGYSNRVEILALYTFDEFIDDWIIDLFNQYNIKTINVNKYEELSSVKEFSTCDVLFAGLMTHIDKILIPQNMKVIGVYHGFRDLELPIEKTALLYTRTIKEYLGTIVKLTFKKMYFNRRYEIQRRKNSKCDYLVADCDHSRYCAYRLFPDIPHDKIKTYYAPKKYVGERYTVGRHPQKIILMLGGDRWIKNTYRGVIALDSLMNKGLLQEYTVNVIGGIPLKIKNRIKNKERFVELSYLSPSDLEEQYAVCDLFFYPSLNEGFGYPPLEVMQYGKTCVLGADTSLIEIFGDSAYYCNPYDVGEMETRILQAINSKKEQAIIQKKIGEIEEREKQDLEKLCNFIIAAGK